jgi:hypothetical protein
LKLDLRCYESAVPDRFKVEIVTRRATSPRTRGTESKEQRRAQNPPPMTLCYLCILLRKFSWTTLVAHAPNSGVPPGRRPHGVPEPGDKSPGSCHLSLRDAFWPAPKATGAKHVLSIGCVASISRLSQAPGFARRITNIFPAPGVMGIGLRSMRRPASVRCSAEIEGAVSPKHRRRDRK